MQRIAYRGPAAPESGLSLIELLTILALSLIVLSIGIPFFHSFAAGNVQSGEINNLVHNLNLARSEAIKSGRNHVLCPSRDLTWCLDDTRWDLGFILFQDRNENGVRDENEPLVNTSRPSAKVGIAMQSSQGRKQIVYRPDGRSAGSNLTLSFCDPEAEIPPRAVILSNAGRVRVSKTAWDGSPLECGKG